MSNTIKNIDAHESVKEVLNNMQLGDTPVVANFKTQYYAVYGSLRVGRGNWEWSYQNFGDHVDTVKVPGFNYTGGLSANYTGNPEHFLVMDIFEVRKDFIDEAHNNIDSLEGINPQQWNGRGLVKIDELDNNSRGYLSVANVIKTRYGNVLCKMYPSSVDLQGEKRSEDIVLDSAWGPGKEELREFFEDPKHILTARKFKAVKEYYNL